MNTFSLPQGYGHATGPVGIQDMTRQIFTIAAIIKVMLKDGSEKVNVKAKIRPEEKIWDNSSVKELDQEEKSLNQRQVR